MKIQTALVAILVGASALPRAAWAQAPNTAVENTARGVRAAPQVPSTNWTEVDTPGVNALARPGAFSQYAPPGGGPGCGCNGCPGNKSGSCLHRLLAWATYCPKERIGCCHPCNHCHYKGFLPIYQIMLTPKCVEGSGIHSTFPNAPCVHGCQGCAAGASCASH